MKSPFFLLFLSLILLGAGCTSKQIVQNGGSYCATTIERNDHKAHFVVSCDWFDESSMSELHLESENNLGTISYTQEIETAHQDAEVTSVEINGEMHQLFLHHNPGINMTTGIITGPVFEQLGGTPVFSYPPTQPQLYDDIMDVLTSVEIEQT